MEQKTTRHHLRNLEEGGEEAEEALSLCDLPLDTKELSNHNVEKMPKHSPKSSADESQDFFDFLSDLRSSEMCSADDIIFCGKLVPFNEQSLFNQTRNSSPINDDQTDAEHIKFRRRSESLSELRSHSLSRSNSFKNKLMRNYHSVDYQKLSRSSSSKNSREAEMERNSSSGKSDPNSLKKGSNAKPRWYLLFFGMLKFPPEMALRDIKSRQVRRNPSTMLFPSVDSGGKLPISRSSDRGSWRFIKALSCKDHASVAVTKSFCMPHV